MLTQLPFLLPQPHRRHLPSVQGPFPGCTMLKQCAHLLALGLVNLTCWGNLETVLLLGLQLQGMQASQSQGTSSMLCAVPSLHRQLLALFLR